MNSKAFNLASTIVVALLLIIGTLLSWGAAQTELDPVTKQAVGDTAAVHNSVVYSLALFWIAIILVLGFTLWGMIINPKRFITTMIGVGVVFIIYLICAGLASDQPTEALAEHPMATPFWLKWADIGIYMTYILFILAIVLLAVQMLRNIFSYVSK
ncbi:MAG: hypothetical protein HYZ14_16890 [Bacteroidetes bacterium]|nr:hypothetical protein [Bacteroidota bacterium]